MQELLQQLIDKAKTDKKVLRYLKTGAVKAQQFELAANLREIENKFFPETDEVKEAKEFARKAELVLRMVEIKTDEPTAWLLMETCKMYAKMKGKFSMDDAIKLMFKKKEIFEVE